MGVKGFVEGGIASIVAGCSTHPLDLIKVRMQLHGENHIKNPTPQFHYLRSAFAFNATGAAVENAVHFPPLPPRVAPISVGMKIFQTEGVAALFSGISATVLRRTLLHHQDGALRSVETKMDRPDLGQLPARAENCSWLDSR